MSNSNESALRAAVEGFNDPDGRERWLDLYSPYVVLHGYPRGLEGHDGARRFYGQAASAAPGSDAAKAAAAALAANGGVTPPR